MATMIPDEVGAGKSIGERRMFDRLQLLPDDCIVYYEPIIDGRYPDFVVILPDHGLLVIECKGWRTSQIVGGDTGIVSVRDSQGGIERATSPVRQAREYMLGLMDRCRKHPSRSLLLHGSGPREGKFMFPFGSCAVMTQIAESEMRSHPGGDLRLIFPTEHVVDADEFDAWATFTGAQLLSRLCHFFKPTWSFPRLSPEQISVSRTIIHPEIVIPGSPADLAGRAAPSGPSDGGLFGSETTLLQLDLVQEREARNFGGGHRLVFGVAGSGKTVVLVARARLLSEAYPTGQVLVLCFNVSLKTYLQSVLTPCSNVTVITFHGWGRRNGVQWEINEPADAFGTRLLTHLQAGQGEAGKYDAVLIDEAQDFEPSWFSCALEAMKEPRNGELLVVGDGNQAAYRRSKISWRQLGIRARGRTRHLTRNYRNTRAILEAAASFAGGNEDDDGISALACEPASSAREGVSRPIFVERETRREECAAIVALVKGLLAGQLGDQPTEPLVPSDIAILYRKTTDALPGLVAHLTESIPVVWLTPPDRTGADPRQRILEPGIKVQTIHSAKGLQYKAVVVAFADALGGPHLPAPADDVEGDRHLLYVALTRPEEHLIVTCARNEHSESPLVERMKRSGAFVAI